MVIVKTQSRTQDKTDKESSAAMASGESGVPEVV